MRISALKTGLVIGLALGFWHLCWAALVAFGAAQALIDFILHLHFIALDMRIEPFDLMVASMLVAVTTLLGFVVGWIAAAIWNGLHPDKAAKAPA